jgi:hypothetical protein
MASGFRPVSSILHGILNCSRAVLEPASLKKATAVKMFRPRICCRPTAVPRAERARGACLVEGGNPEGWDRGLLMKLGMGEAILRMTISRWEDVPAALSQTLFCLLECLHGVHQNNGYQRKNDARRDRLHRGVI